jgi:DNA transformation protein
MMTSKNEFITYLLELFEPMGAVEARAMFGGFGIYREGLMFGLVAKDCLYLKADDENRPDYESRALPPFTYERKGKKLSMSYYQAPSEVMDSGEELSLWGERAYQAARRAEKIKKSKKRTKQ